MKCFRAKRGVSTYHPSPGKMHPPHGLEARATWVSAEVIRIWLVIVEVLAAVEVALFWEYLRDRVKRLGDERLAGRCNSIRTGLIAGILGGAVVGALLHNRRGVAYETRVFAPIPGRLILVAFKVWVPLLLLNIARTLSIASTVE